METLGGHGEGGGAFGEDAVGAACGETLGEVAEGGEASGEGLGGGVGEGGFGGVEGLTPWEEDAVGVALERAACG